MYTPIVILNILVLLSSNQIWSNPRPNNTMQERCKDIHTIDAKNVEEDDCMVINTEWGAFGEKAELDFIRTKWDEAVDAASLNPGKQIFEKMISGMYMGELTRQVLVDMTWEELLFTNLTNTDPLFEWGNFLTRYVSEIESDPVGEFTRARWVEFEIWRHGREYIWPRKGQRHCK